MSKRPLWVKIKSANPQMTWREAIAFAQKLIAEGRKAQEDHESRLAHNAMIAGTGKKSLEKYVKNLRTWGRLTKREKGAIRRAIQQGKQVPPALIQEVKCTRSH